jgi:enoyl-CoA hydratase/carnithine racemase
MSDFCLIERNGPIATVTINRPTKRNVFIDGQDCHALISAFDELELDTEIKVVVLTGAGSAFCAGGDLDAIIGRYGIGGGPDAMSARNSYQHGLHAMITALWRFDKPLISAVNGPAIGLGCNIALMGDIRIATTRAKFAVGFTRIGLVPGDGSAWLLPKVIGSSAATAMLLRCNTISAVEAAKLGIVSEIVPDDQLPAHANAIAREIAESPAEALRLTKRLIRESISSSLAQSLELASSMQAIALNSEGHQQAIAKLQRA